jgi:hypothetical protein
MKQRIISGMLVVVSAIFMVVLAACGSGGTVYSSTSRARAEIGLARIPKSPYNFIMHA